MVCEITADDGDDATAGCCRRDRETEEIDVGKRPRDELVEPAVGRGEGGGGGGGGPGGGGGCMPVSGGRRARLLARMGVRRTSDGLRVIALALVLAPAASRR
jgi:hypothetical protein